MPRAAGSGAGLSFGDGTPVPERGGSLPRRLQLRPSPGTAPLSSSSSSSFSFHDTPGALPGSAGSPPGGVRPRPAHPRCRWHKGPSVTPPLPIFSRCRSRAPAPGTRVTPPRIPRGTPVTAPRRGRTGLRGPERPEGQRGTAQGHRGRRAGVPRGPGCGLTTPASLRRSGSVAPARATARGARGGSSTPGAGTESLGESWPGRATAAARSTCPGRSRSGSLVDGAGDGVQVRCGAGARPRLVSGCSGAGSVPAPTSPPCGRDGDDQSRGEETEARAVLAHLCRARAGSPVEAVAAEVPWRWRRVRP